VIYVHEKKKVSDGEGWMGERIRDGVEAESQHNSPLLPMDWEMIRLASLIVASMKANPYFATPSKQTFISQFCIIFKPLLHVYKFLRPSGHRTDDFSMSALTVKGVSNLDD
jgi:hypothetical protein